MPALNKRYTCYYTDDNGDYYCQPTAWDNWIRWVVLAVIIILFFLLFACCSITTARRRRRRGLTPFYGTGWAAPHGQPYGQPHYGNGQPHNQHWSQPAPPYSAQPEYYQHNGFYGPQQNGVELQNQGPVAPQQAHARGGDNVYEPPAGPPPKKGDGIIR